MVQWHAITSTYIILYTLSYIATCKWPSVLCCLINKTTDDHPNFDNFRRKCYCASVIFENSVLATAPHSPPLTLLETSASYMTNISLFSDQISSTSRSCYYHICQLRCIRPYLDTKTASTIATSIVPLFTLDYCNSLYHNLPMSQITRLQQIQNSLARAVVTPLPSFVSYHSQ